MPDPEHHMDVLFEKALQTYKQTLERQGYINFPDLPEGFDHISFVQRFGSLMRQYDGQLIWSIKPEAGFENVYHSLNSKPLTPHTECYEFEGIPPRYLALWCITAPEGEGGETTLADGYAFIASLTEEERLTISTRICEFRSTPGLQESKLGGIAHHPIYDPGLSSDEPIIRYSFACLNDNGDPFISAMRQKILSFCEETSIPILYKERSLLIWDNWRMLHARTGFRDPKRHLKRVWLSA